MQQLSTEHAFETLYKKYQEPITRALLTLVHDKERAVELCQDTFLLLLVELSRQDTTLKTDYHVKNWLYHTAKHRAIDYLRSNKPVVYLSQSESEADSLFNELAVEGVEDGVIDRHSDEEATAAIARAIAKLPPKQRDSVKLRYIDGLTEKEAAEKLGITPKTVSTNAGRGIAKMRSKIFAVSYDLQERRRVSKRIDRIIDMMVRGEIESVPYSIRAGIYTEEAWWLDPLGGGVYEVEHDNEIMTAIVDVRHIMNDYFYKEVPLFWGPEGSKEKELETLEESDQTLRDIERYYDRTFRKPWWRILIDHENQKRGLLSDTAELGACGQYLF